MKKVFSDYSRYINIKNDIDQFLDENLDESVSNKVVIIEIIDN